MTDPLPWLLAGVVGLVFTVILALVYTQHLDYEQMIACVGEGGEWISHNCIRR